jgi:hypothetical protein
VKRKYILASILVLLISALLLYKNFNQTKPSTAQVVQEDRIENNLELIINFGDNNIKSYNTKTGLEATAFSILKEALEKDKITIETIQYDFGVFVKKIGEFESTAKKSWIYYVNGESGQIAADQMKLKNGDRVEWKYETPK